jgi:UDP-glucose 4-epimerase
MSKTILITGVAGFIGSNLAVRLLQEKRFRVIGVDNLAYGLKSQIPPGVEFHPLDIRSPSIYPLFEGVDAVYHLAAKNCISDCQSNPMETSDINITGTINVLEACRKGRVRKLIYAESSALYEGLDQFPSQENQISPQSFYALSKAASREFAEKYAQLYGLATTALRYFCVYGPRQDYRRTVPPVFSAFIIKLLKKEQPTIYGTGQKRRDFIYVDDVNDFHLQCLDDERTNGKVFNLGSGANHSIQEIYQTIASLLKSPIQPVYKNDLAEEAQVTLADITEAKRLGWTPKTDLKEGLLHSIRFIQSELQQGNITS